MIRAVFDPRKIIINQWQHLYIDYTAEQGASSESKLNVNELQISLSRLCVFLKSKIIILESKLSMLRPQHKKKDVLLDNLCIQHHYLRVFCDYHLDWIQALPPAQQLPISEEIASLRYNSSLLAIFYDRLRLWSHLPEERDSISRQDILTRATEQEQTCSSISILTILCLVTLPLILTAALTAPAELFRSTLFQADFRIWRGAAYFLVYNWALAGTLVLCNYFHINYRLILVEEQTFLPHPRSFIVTALESSFVYELLLGIYFQKQWAVLPFLTWIYILLFLINPLSILNKQGRVYFLALLWKFMATLWSPMSMNIFFFAINLNSFFQIFHDLAFTVCRAVSLNEAPCKDESFFALLVFAITYFIYRCVQSVRSHIQFGSKLFSRPVLGLIASVFSLNSFLSFYLYFTLKTPEMFNYWLCSAAIATFTGLNADYRADWGLISFDRGECLLRKNKIFSRYVYLVVCFLDIPLSLTWLLFISPQTAISLGVNSDQLLLITTSVELCRKCMWCFFRLEEDQSENIANFRATARDDFLYEANSQETQDILRLKAQIRAAEGMISQLSKETASKTNN